MRTSLRRRSSRRVARRVRLSNPPRRKHHSPAMRAKIGRAVKAAMRRRSGGGTTVSRRRRTIRHARPTMAVARRRSYSAPARRSNRIVMGRLLNPRGGRRRRSFRRRNPSFSGSFSSIKGMLNKDVVWMAGGAIVASVGTGYIMNRFGGSLPGATNKWGVIAYQLAIPMGAAYLLRSKNRAFAQGLVVGGVVMAITSIMKSGIVNNPFGSAVSGYSLAGELGRGQGTRSLGEYIGPRTFNTIPKAVNAAAFAPGAW